jgi:hypothetical protein
MYPNIILQFVMEQKSEVFYMFSVYALKEHHGRADTHEHLLTTELLFVQKTCYIIKHTYQHSPTSMYSCSTLLDKSNARLRASSRDKSLVGVEMARDFGLLRFGVTDNNRSQQTNIQTGTQWYYSLLCRYYVCEFGLVQADRKSI